MGSVMAAYGLPRGSDAERSVPASGNCERFRAGEPGAAAGGGGGVVKSLSWPPRLRSQGKPERDQRRGGRERRWRGRRFESCEMNVQANLSSIDHSVVRAELTAELAHVLAARDKADGVVDSVLGHGSA